MSSGAVLVTGVTCPLGQSVARMLVAQGRPVVGLGRRAAAFPVLPEPQFRSVIGDLTDANALAQVVKGCDAVIHVAALSSPWARVADLRSINVDATHGLLTAACAAGVRRFIQVSSASVTFHGSDAWDVREETPYPQRWLCAYSASKAAAEVVVRAQANIETVILRPRAIYGPGDRTLLPRIIARARTGRLRRLVPEDVQQSLTYVDNIAHACVLAVDGPPGHIWNVTDAEPVGLWHTIDTVLARLGIAPAGRPVPTALVRGVATVAEKMHRLFPFLGEPTLTRYTAALLTHHQTMSLAAIERDLGYRPLVSGAEGLERTAAAMLAAHS